MVRITIRELTMPIAAFSMVFVLGGYIYGAIGAAKANAHVERQKKHEEYLKQRADYGLSNPKKSDGRAG